MSTESDQTSSVAPETVEVEKKKPFNVSQFIFKNLSIVINIIIALCIPGFIKFRTYCQDKGYYVFNLDSILWCIVGFFTISIVRYSYYRILRKPIQKILNPKYEGQEKARKIQMLLKLSYDTIFYLATTTFCYVMFRQQYWFPTSAGGQGSCSEIYKDYPNWPSNNREWLQTYFMFHLGVHLFSIFELITVRRSKERKFYEWMMHHTVASSLILFSMTCNEITAGVMILIVHDASDIFLAGARFYFESHFKKSNFVTGIVVVLMFVMWIYFRLIIFPFCLLSNVYINSPLPSDEWSFIYYEYMYLVVMAFLLVGMHIYWTLFIFRSAYNSLGKKKIVNNYDVHKKQ